MSFRGKRLISMNMALFTQRVWGDSMTVDVVVSQQLIINKMYQIHSCTLHQTRLKKFPQQNQSHLPNPLSLHCHEPGQGDT